MLFFRAVQRCRSTFARVAFVVNDFVFRGQSRNRQYKLVHFLAAALLRGGHVLTMIAARFSCSSLSPRHCLWSTATTPSESLARLSDGREGSLLEAQLCVKRYLGARLKQLCQDVESSSRTRSWKNSGTTGGQSKHQSVDLHSATLRLSFEAHLPPSAASDDNPYPPQRYDWFRHNVFSSSSCFRDLDTAQRLGQLQLEQVVLIV